MASDETTYGNQLILDNQKFFDTHLKQNHAAINLKNAQNADTSKSLGYHVQFDEENELKSRLSIIRRLREEIEQIDTNLVRYNVKCESDDFVKLILQFSPDKETMVFTKIDMNPKKSQPSKEKGKPASATPAVATNRTPAPAATTPVRNVGTNGNVTAAASTAPKVNIHS